MKSVLKEFFELMGYCVLVVCFLFASFLLLINVYHYKELNKVDSRSLGTESTYLAVKDAVSNIEKNVSSVKFTDSSNKSNGGMLIRDSINTCTDYIKNSSFYKLSDKTEISEKDIYDTNKEMYNTLNNKCLFFIPYYVESAQKTYGVGSSYDDELKDDVEFTKNKIASYSDFLYNKSLGNSSYNYSTSISTSTIYNDLNKSINLTISNYEELARTVEKISLWYVDEFGGAR